MKSEERGANARETALDILVQLETKQAYSNLLLNQVLGQSCLDDRDRRLVTELVYGTIQRLNTLDWILGQLLKKGSRSLEPWVRQLLRIGIYQLLYLDRIPERAAIYETVQISKKRGHKGISGLVNGVLRSFLRKKQRLTPPRNPQTLREKAISYSHPEWMIERMEQVYGAEETKAALLSNQIPPKVSIRINQLKMGRDQFIKLWHESEKGKAEASAVAPEGVLIHDGGNPAYSSWFQKGFFTIQDESSMLVARALSPRPGMKVLDVCAAPGGKTTHLAELMENQGEILACDVHEHKLSLIRSNVLRLGIKIVSIAQQDGTMLAKRFAPGTFDAILLDAPCSGLGVIRRKPDLKWSKEARNIDSLVRLQKSLLDSAAPLLKAGGALVYSTCTWEPRENEEQVKSFLKRHPDFEMDRQFVEKLSPAVKKAAQTGTAWVQILPHHLMSDGFFISRVVKKR
ncbi:16S rRNA (cytosine(967)-C(5))-methyltransferase RsmB [Thermoactinomyces mirandus]|uniref:16S rRNA (cytosine(967)-C(5))-methyltransferase n=1 Tax=Thermoactinomyces mirandus TaxID=2756294 RepID=A0A7W2ASE3_9BACL|nr:16S rRNA (cytosine(967)-C(5))-methyltransferase RsmB [Thermoactinomyces mirandus]MBA4602391.1 16S rRNA (cytosine(967)-C(5))-methyltransferase RsmB [Thermoactinomyces mirandus]